MLLSLLCLLLLLLLLHVITRRLLWLLLLLLLSLLLLLLLLGRTQMMMLPVRLFHWRVHAVANVMRRRPARLVLRMIPGGGPVRRLSDRGLRL